jgi:hypothetical protein
VRDGLGLDPFHVLGHSRAVGSPSCTPWAARADKLAVGRVKSRSCVWHRRRSGLADRSQPGGCCLAVPSARADVCDLTVGGSSGIVPAALSFAAKTGHERAW